MLDYMILEYQVSTVFYPVSGSADRHVRLYDPRILSEYSVL